MRYDSSVTVNYANLTYAFVKFQEQYKNLCLKISENKRSALISSYKSARSFIYEYLVFSKSKQFRSDLLRTLDNVREELYSDTEYNKLAHNNNKSPTQMIAYNQKYFTYLVKILKIIGLFGDELSRTFMPNKTDREKALRYWNNNSFFEQFTYYKSNVSEKLSEFSLLNFQKGFAYFLGFYFAYYLFVDDKSRVLCEAVLSNILNIVLTEEVLDLIISYQSLGSERRTEFRGLDMQIHDALGHVFFRCNYSYSSYGILPRMQERITIDRTSI